MLSEPSLLGHLRWDSLPQTRKLKDYPPPVPHLHDGFSSSADDFDLTSR
jgi:hypothetical protein